MKKSSRASKIVTSPHVLFGKPRIKGTRIPVHQILQCLSEGWSHKKILSEFPVLKEDDIKACINYACDVMENIHVIELPKKSKIAHA